MSSQTTLLLVVVLLLSVAITVAGGGVHAVSPSTDSSQSLSHGYELLKTVPHDSLLFTQGLEFYDGKLIESGGLYKYSTLNYVLPESGDVTNQIAIPAEFFAEGLTIVDDIIYMLTWRERKVLVFEAKTFQVGVLLDATVIIYNVPYLVRVCILVYWPCELYLAHQGGLGFNAQCRPTGAYCLGWISHNYFLQGT
jgi:hypothetical protein